MLIKVKKDSDEDQLTERQKLQGRELAESWSRMDGRSIRGYEKYGKIDFLKGVDDDNERAVLARLYENTLHWLKGLDEATRTLQVGPFEKFVFPILRAMMANLVAAELVTVSPLDAPTGLVFYLDAIYGSTKGNIPAGSKAMDVRTGPSQHTHYSDEIIEEESIGTGNGVTTHFTGTLAYMPIRPGTVVITDGTNRINDDGNGNLVGNIGAASTIAYQNGNFDVTFVAAPADGNAITVNYEYNSEGSTLVPEIDINLTSAPITARRQALKARWSLEAQQDFQSYHGVSAEVELVSVMANLLAKELNYKIVRHLMQVASAAGITWDRSPAAGGVPWIWHKESLYDAFIMQSNYIFQATQRAQGNWIVASTDVSSIVETLSRFTRSGSVGTSVAGVRKIGTLDDFTIYKDPTMEDHHWLMGYKGSSFLDTGYVHAPYLQVYTTNTIVLDDMIARKAMAMRSGQKVINSRMYSVGTLVQTGTMF